jgi:hypothetical protein
MFNFKLLNYFGWLLLLLLSSQANALQMNLMLDKDIVNNNDRINIFYDLNFSDSSVSQQIKGMNQQIFSLWIDAFNKENKDLMPLDFHGKHSEISLGYRKDGHNYYLESCQHINLTDIKIITILLSENGCKIS